MSGSSAYRRWGKRLLDLTLVALASPVLLPAIALVAIVVRVGSGSPVFFSQERIGRGGRCFHIYKFRTMVVRKGQPLARAETITRAGDARLTRVGAVLRRYKLDELPQVWNVVRGDMSFVGPRPDVPGYADRLTGEQRVLLELRPGITGPATLAFRDEESLLADVEDPLTYNDTVIFPAKVELNLEYARDCGLAADLDCLWKTVRSCVVPSSGPRPR